MRCNFVHFWLSIIYGKFGEQIGRHPILFIAIPLILTGLVSTGLLKLVIIKDLEFLITPLNGRSITERKAVESIFPPDADEIDILRLSRFPRYGWIILEARDGGSMLRESIMDELALLDQRIRNITLTKNGRNLNYSAICQKSYDGECFFNPVLNLRGKISDINRKEYNIRYPIDVDELTFYVTVYAYNLGGVTTDENGFVKDVKAFRLFYNLESNTPEKMIIADKWEDAFLNHISEDDYENILVYKFLRKSWDEESSKVTESVLPMLILAIAIMVVFGAVSCMASDWRISKPVVGICGALSSGIGVLFAFSFLQICGANCADLTIGVPFLILGVGMDDAFVLLAAWRLTDPKKSVEERMKETYSESALSVTITSLTNFIASCIGLTAPYRIIRIYCLHMAVSVICVYLIQLTFYGGCLSFSGYIEKSNFQDALCYTIKHKNKDCCSQGSKMNNATKVNFLINSIFYKIGKILTYKITKLCILCLYIIYLFISIYYTTHLRAIFKYYESLPYYSYAMKFMNAQYKYFREYPLSIQVIINKTLDYSDPTVQNDVNAILTKIANAPNMAGTSIMDSWLHQYLRFASEPISRFTLGGYNLSEPEDFIQGFKIFVKLRSAKRYRGDVIFNENGTKIMASRFILQSVNLVDSFVENKLIKNLWGIADSAKYPVFVHNLYFFLYDMNSELVSTTLQCLYISALVIIVVYFVFVTDVICAICISVTIISVEVGVMGFMVLWNVPLNIISMICLVLSVGFCVDYSAHVCYVYVNSHYEDVNVKLQNSLKKIGYPVFQGCLSTILGVIVLSRAPSDVFIIFFKIIFLVMIFSFVHGVFLLPLTLSVWDEFLNFLKPNKKLHNAHFVNVPLECNESQLS